MMRRVALAVLLAACSLGLAQDNVVVIKFAKVLTGKTIRVLVDGRVEKTFAGKMGFQDVNHSWQSVCADIHSPVSEGQFYRVRPVNSEIAGGNYAKAGRIVAKYFHEATTPEQCAGLQIAVWEAIEVGGDKPVFNTGKFQVQADSETMYYATMYYSAAQQPVNTGNAQQAGNGDSENAQFGQTSASGATLLQAGSGQGQSQMSPTS